MFKELGIYFNYRIFILFIAIVIFGVILNRIKIAHLSKIIPAFVPLFLYLIFIKSIKKEKYKF
ncbi:hypothetical protein LH402_10310 [Fusobacterium nucleatum]